MTNDRYNKIMTEIKRIFGDEIIYLVGGAVRDIIMNIEPKDFDFVTPLSPGQIEMYIKRAGRKAYTVGKRFGTLGFTVNGEKVEVTTYRTEKYVKNNRKPEVEFCTTLKEDLSRRDFTINSIAVNCYGIDVMTDYFNGEDDISNKIIRCVGNPIKRFKEDPLRMLRAIRFACNLNFNIDGKTYQSIVKKNYKILQISKERWMEELNKILLSNNVKKGLRILMYTKLVNYMIPELSLQFDFNQENPHHIYTLWEHTMGVVANTPKNLNLRWAALLHDIAKPFVKTYNSKKRYYNYIKHDYLGAEIVEKIGRYLKWSNSMRNGVVDLVLNHLNDNSPLRQYDVYGKIFNK